MRSLTEENLHDLITGATILGAGGGGPVKLAQDAVEFMKEQNLTVELADPLGDVGADQALAVSAGIGSPAAAEHFDFKAPSKAFGLLELLLRELHARKTLAGPSRRVNQTTGPLEFVLPGEVGAANSLIPVVTAALHEIPVIDAAGAPRAMPTLSEATYAVAGLPVSPIVLADEKNEISLVHLPDAALADEAIRGLLSGGNIFPETAGVAFWAMEGSELQAKGNAILGMTTVAIGLGTALREATSDPVSVVSQYLSANGMPTYTMFQGRDLQQTQSTSGGFDYLTVTLQGTGHYKGQVYTIIGQNENIIAWNSTKSQPDAMAPDLITYLTSDGKAFNNADVSPAEDKEVVILGVAAGSYRTPEVIAQYMPVLNSMGYAGEYVKIEDLQ